MGSKYPDSYDTTSTTDVPSLSNLKKTWYVKTNENGRARLAEEYVVNNSTYKSDSFYYNTGNPNPTIPIGTIVVREVVAPENFKISSKVFYRRVAEGMAIVADENTPISIDIDEPRASSISTNLLDSNTGTHSSYASKTTSRVSRMRGLKG